MGGRCSAPANSAAGPPRRRLPWRRDAAKVNIHPWHNEPILDDLQGKPDFRHGGRVPRLPSKAQLLRSAVLSNRQSSFTPTPAS